MTGITTGQSVQIAGPPGIGKTTITVAMALEARLEVCQRARRREEKERARREKRERSRSRGRSASRGRGLREDASDKAEENHESSREGVQEGQVLIIGELRIAFLRMIRSS